MNATSDSNSRLSLSVGLAAVGDLAALYAEEIPGADVGDMLSEMTPGLGGRSADPAAWDSWVRCARSRAATHLDPSSDGMSLEEGFAAAFQFLASWWDSQGPMLTSEVSDAIAATDGVRDEAVWERWLAAVEKVLAA